MANGSTIYNTDRAKRYGLMVPLIRELIMRGQSKDKEYFKAGVTTTQGSLLTTKWMASENFNGVVVNNMRAIGKTARCTDREFLCGLMDESMLGSTLTIQKTDMGCLHGRTERCTNNFISSIMMDSGRMVNNMEEALFVWRTIP